MPMNALGSWSTGSVIERFDSFFDSGQVVYMSLHVVSTVGG